MLPSGITFDFWNTLMYEPPGSLLQARLDAMVDRLPHSRSDLEAAHGIAFAEYQIHWRENQQYVIEHAAAAMARELGDAGLEPTILQSFIDGGGAATIRLCPGIADALHALHDEGVRLGIICDIGLTPSTVLRRALDSHGLLDLFDGWSFSDEVGVYKPDPQIFDHAAQSLSLSSGPQLAHVGDRVRTDVGGARAKGWRSVRYTAIYDDPETTPATDADVVCGEYADLLALLEKR